MPYDGASTTALSADQPLGALTTAKCYGRSDTEMCLDGDNVMFRMLTLDEIKIGMAFAPDYLWSV